MNQHLCNMTPRQQREIRLRLFQQLHQDTGEWHRASGEMYCKNCGLQYRYHPVEEQYDIDHRLCDGELVHL
jgi:uncharacterized protein YbaR (Trm112 family)